MYRALPPSAFQNATLRSAAWGAAVTRIMADALQAVEPATAVHRHLRRNGSTFTIGTRAYNLRDYARIFVVGAGKASVAMLHAVMEILRDDMSAAAIIVKDDPTNPPYHNQVTAAHHHIFPARHPLPDERGVAATRHIATLLEQTTPRDLVLVLISGGGSALLTLPAPGISLDDMQTLTSELLACGATINEINSLRKHLDLVKGGGLARMAAPATVATLILSDVVGNPLDVIASGPTVPDNTTFADAYRVLEYYNLVNYVPRAIVSRLKAGMRDEMVETLTANNAIFAHAHSVLVGSNEQAITGALEAARSEGWNARALTLHPDLSNDGEPSYTVWERVPQPGNAPFSGFQGEAHRVGRHLSGIVRALTNPSASSAPSTPLHAMERPLCLVLGGETTVTLRGSGQGGRNQEVALAAVRDMAGLADVALITLATDGGDGPTDAAGAVVTGTTLARAQALGLDPDAALANNDSYPFFAALDDLLRPGVTGTNVNDLVFLLAF